jgi:hypothetical protein
MPRPKTACLDCGALCYAYRCSNCFQTYMNIQTERKKANQQSTSWWIGVPREQFSQVVQAQRGRMESA